MRHIHRTENLSAYADVLCMETFYGSPRLDNARDGLDEPKGDCQSQNQHGYPECIPLYSLAVIIPPRPERLRLGVVEGLL